MTVRLLALTGTLLVPLTAAVAQLPCSPCAAVRGSDRERLAQQLRTAPGR